MNAQGAVYTGPSMLIPLAFEPQWTRIDDGIFNDYPPPPPPPPPPLDPGSPAAQIAQAINETVQGVPVPNGPIEWNNPTTAATMPITPSVDANNPILNGNKKRNLLIIQNSSKAATSADEAPDLLVNFASRVNAAASIRLPAGVGIVLDYIVPRDDVYVAWDGGTGTFTQQGTITQGSHSPGPTINPYGIAAIPYRR